MKIIAITPTCDRPFAFARCQKMLARQTVQPYLWIVVDGGVFPLTFDPNIKLPPLCYVRREPQRDDPGHSLVCNLAKALPFIEPDDLLVFLDDDDYYSADWLERIQGEMGSCDIAGMARNLYYDIRTRRYLQHANIHHSSMASTALARAGIQALREECQNVADPMIDGRLWRREGLKQNLFACDKPKVIGIKGLPGKEGVDGHDPTTQRNWKADPDASWLRSLIGNDVEEMRYGECYVGSANATKMIWVPKAK